MNPHSIPSIGPVVGVALVTFFWVIVQSAIASCTQKKETECAFLRWEDSESITAVLKCDGIEEEISTVSARIVRKFIDNPHQRLTLKAYVSAGLETVELPD